MIRILDSNGNGVSRKKQIHTEPVAYVQVDTKLVPLDVEDVVDLYCDLTNVVQTIHKEMTE